MTNRTIYLLEDDESICELVECALSINNIKIKCFNTIAEFYKAFDEQVPTIALLDIMLTDGSGLDVLKDIKKRRQDVYVIMLSALGKEVDKVKGLNLGADDYIAKPFGILELSAKINAVLRRIGDSNDSIIEIDNLKININTQEVLVDDNRIKINNKEFLILEYLVKNKNQVLTRDNILEHVFGYDSGEAWTLDNYIAHLRKEGVVNIETIYGVGYSYKGGAKWGKDY